MLRKSVFCIRHGESTFNAAYRATGMDPMHFDAPLTDEGHRQVREARANLQEITFDLVVTSPLTRALQTTTGLFTGHPANPRILVEAMHRERAESSCDIGRAPTLLAAEFPAFEIGHLPEIWWHAEGDPNERGICVEPVEVFQARVAGFRSWLLARPERTIAVVGHGTFFYHFTGQWLDNCQVLPLHLNEAGAELAL
jgi:broad specificity phosphatase PhoE